jgi:hypothetical protein
VALVDTSADGNPDLAVFGTENGNLRAVNAVTGAFVWDATPDPGYWIFMSPSVSTDQQVIYVGTFDVLGIGAGKAHAIDAKTGSILGSFDPAVDGVPALSPVAVTAAPVYINDSTVLVQGYGTGVSSYLYVCDRTMNFLGRSGNNGAMFAGGAFYLDQAGLIDPTGDSLFVVISEELGGVSGQPAVLARYIPGARATGASLVWTYGLPYVTAQLDMPVAHAANGIGLWNDNVGYMHVGDHGTGGGFEYYSKDIAVSRLVYPGYNLSGVIVTDSTNDSGIVAIVSGSYAELHAFNHYPLPRARWVSTASELLLNTPTELAGTDTDTAHFANVGDGPGLYSVATDSVLVAALKNPNLTSSLRVNYRQTSAARENFAAALADQVSLTSRNKFFNKSISPSQRTMLLDELPELSSRTVYRTKDKLNPTSAWAPPAWLTINDLTGGGPTLAGDTALIEATADANGLNFGIYYAEILMTVTPTEPDPDLYGGTDIALPVRFVIGFIPEEVIISTPVIDKLVTNFASVGDDAGSVSFAYNGVNQLFDGSIILGSTNTTLAMDVFAHSLSGIAPDSVLTVTDLTDSVITGTAFLATVGSQVRVVQTTRSYNDAERAGFMIYRLDITNVTDTLIPNLAVGIFLDLDVGVGGALDYTQNLGGMDTTYKIFYVYYTPAPEFRCGIMRLPFTKPVHGFNVLDNNVYVYPNSDVVDDSVWNIMSAGGFSTTGAGAPDDHSFLLTFSYADLDSGETRVEEFAFFGYDTTLVTTDSLANLINGMSTGVRPIANPPAALPKSYELGQNFPNPFNATTQIRFNVPAASQVSLDVYDILGRKVRTLVNDYLTAGVKQILWDGRNQSGDQVASGVYFYRMTAGDYNQIKKMVLLK